MFTIRLQITLKNPEGIIKVPFNYNHILSAILYNKIKDVLLSEKMHESKDFKFFTFSQLYIKNKKRFKRGFISLSGEISFYFSSPNEELVLNILDGFLDDKEVLFINQKLVVNKIEVIKNPEFSEKMEFNTLSPLYAKIIKIFDNKKVQWDLTPGESFFKALEKNLIKKYIKYNNLNHTDKTINVYSQMKKVKRKRITIKNGNESTFHRCFLMDVVLEGDIDLIRFAYDCGLSEKNSMGFGMLKVGG